MKIFFYDQNKFRRFSWGSGSPKENGHLKKHVTEDACSRLHLRNADNHKLGTRKNQHHICKAGKLRVAFFYWALIGRGPYWDEKCLIEQPPCAQLTQQKR